MLSEHIVTYNGLDTRFMIGKWIVYKTTFDGRELREKKMSQNKETLETVVKDGVPQKVRNILHKVKLDTDAEKLKKEINNFLWSNLRMSTTLRESEILASRIFVTLYCHNNRLSET